VTSALYKPVRTTGKHGSP